MTLESTLEKAFVKAVEKRGGECIKLTSSIGIPDRLVLLPGRKVAFFELKKPNAGRLSKMQKRWLLKLDELGFVARRIDNIMDVETIIDYLTKSD